MSKETKRGDYNFAFLDEGSKREIRRAVLHAIAVPGYQAPFGSRELPIGRGWGTGGIQLTMSLIGPDDTLKVIDQGNDDSVNAVSIKRLICDTTGVETTTDTARADIIQSRHRIPRRALAGGPGAGAPGAHARAPAQRGPPRGDHPPAPRRRGNIPASGSTCSSSCSPGAPPSGGRTIRCWWMAAM